MIANPVRGEILARLDGEDRLLCLTLGALAHLEAVLGAKDLSGLAERFSDGRLKSNDLLDIIHAGLLGGGNQFTREEVAEMRINGGVSGYAAIAAELLNVTFTPIADLAGESPSPKA